MRVRLPKSWRNIEGEYARLVSPGRWSATVGHERLTRARPGRAPHAHGWQARYVVKGEMLLKAGGRWQKAHAGELLITRWGEVHSTGEIPDQQHECYFVKFQGLRPGKRLMSLPADTGAWLLGCLNAMPHVIPASRRLPALFRETLRAGEKARKDDALSETQAYASLLTLLLEIVRCSRARNRRDEGDWRTRILAFLRDNVHRPLGIKNMAEHMEMSAEAFRSRFRRTMAIGAADCFLRMKMDRAQRLLRDTKRPVSDIAASLGFATSQYFATAFRRCTGLTPGGCRSVRAHGRVQ